MRYLFFASSFALVSCLDTTKDSVDWAGFSFIVDLTF